MAQLALRLSSFERALVALSAMAGSRWKKETKSMVAHSARHSQASFTGVCIVLTGFPERVHRVVDVLEHVMPGGFAWSEYAELLGQGAITLEGHGIPPDVDPSQMRVQVLL